MKFNYDIEKKMNFTFIRCLILFVLVIARCTECSVDTTKGRESTLNIDLDVIKSNYESLIKKLPPKHPVMAVVKGNAYGVGAVAVSNTVLELGAKYLAVAFVDEGVHLRMHGIKAPILVLGYTAPNGQGIDLAIRHNLTLNVFTKDVLDAIQRKTLCDGKPVKIHIKVNTGMMRLGVEPYELVPFVKLIKNGSYSRIVVEGVFSHFASLGDVTLSGHARQYARDQLLTFKRVVKQARNVINIPIAHIASSNAIEFFGEEAFLDMVRPGSSISGFMPFTKPALSLTSIVSAIRKPSCGKQLGYQLNTTASGHQWIATVPLGYGDGLRTECSNSVGNVLIRGIRVPIVSGIMMDQMLVDVSKVYPIAVGEPVVVIGRQQKEEITVNEIAELCGGTDYSLSSQLSRRIPRVYFKNEQVVYFENDLLMY